MGAAERTERIPLGLESDLAIMGAFRDAILKVFLVIWNKNRYVVFVLVSESVQRRTFRRCRDSVESRVIFKCLLVALGPFSMETCLKLVDCSWLLWGTPRSSQILRSLGRGDFSIRWVTNKHPYLLKAERL